MLQANERGRRAARGDRAGSPGRHRRAPQPAATASCIERQHSAVHASSARRATASCAQRLQGLDLERLHAQTEAFRAATDTAYPGLLEPELARALGVRFSGSAPLGPAAVLPCRRRGSATSPPSGSLPTASWRRCAGSDRRRRAGRRRCSTSSRARTNRRARSAPRCASPARSTSSSPRSAAGTTTRRCSMRAGTPSTSPHVDRELPFEFRYLGDNSVTEAFAFLFQHLVENPEWLRAGSASTTRRTRRPRSRLTTRLSAPVHGQARLRARAARRGGAASTRSPRATPSCSARRSASSGRRENFLSDVDPGFYSRLLPAGMGARDAPAPHLRDRSDRPGSSAGGRATCCAACGATVSAGRRRSCWAS